MSGGAQQGSANNLSIQKQPNSNQLPSAQVNASNAIKQMQNGGAAGSGGPGAISEVGALGSLSGADLNLIGLGSGVDENSVKGFNGTSSVESEKVSSGDGFMSLEEFGSNGNSGEGLKGKVRSQGQGQGQRQMQGQMQGQGQQGQDPTRFSQSSNKPGQNDFSKMMSNMQEARNKEVPQPPKRSGGMGHQGMGQQGMGQMGQMGQGMSAGGMAGGLSGSPF